MIQWQNYHGYGNHIGLRLHAAIDRRWGGSMSAPIWPILRASIALLDLFRLAIPMLDLTFIWHRCIRQSVAVGTLNQRQNTHHAVPNAMMELGRRHPAATRNTP
jgi:hypothetical protein